MPKHALDRATIADLILSRLAPDAGTQLFLLNFESLILRDFSRYEPEPPREFGSKPPDARISGEYLSIIEELMQAELPADQSQKFKALLSALNAASPDEAGDLARAQTDDIRNLFRFFPQDCFALIGGAFFEAFLKGNAPVHPFKQNKGVYFAGVDDQLRSLYSPTSPFYSFVEWLTAPFRLEKEWLYVAPVICDGSFFGLLYRFSEDAENKTVARELRDALAAAETLFRDMRYALIADVAERIGRLEDPLDAFLAELPNYQNVAIAAAGSAGGHAVVYGRTFVHGVPSPERRFAWERMPAAHIYAQEEINAGAQARSTPSSSWVDVMRDDKKVEAISLKREGVRQRFRAEAVRAYEEAGLSICYGVVIPGQFIGPDYDGRYLELYFFEPAEAKIKRGEKRFTQGVRRKLYSLIPLLQEIAVLESSKASAAMRLNQIIISLVFHEIRNALVRRTEVSEFADGGGVPDWLTKHVNRCLDALYGGLEEMKPCTRDDWYEVRKWLKSYWSRYVNNKHFRVAGWPRGLGPIKLSKELMYVIGCELIKNANAASAQSIEIRLTSESALGAANLSAINDAKSDDTFSDLKRTLDTYRAEGLMARRRHGLALIMQLLQVLHSGKAPSLDADMVSDKIRISCYLTLASLE
jgi:hypothetical protein